MREARTTVHKTGPEMRSDKMKWVLYVRHSTVLLHLKQKGYL